MQAKISELKNRLSYYLARVRRGESILVLDRDRSEEHTSELQSR